MHATLTILHNADEYRFMWLSNLMPGFFSQTNERSSNTVESICLTGITSVDVQKVEMLHRYVNAAARTVSFSGFNPDFSISKSSVDGISAFDSLGRVLFAQLVPDSIQQQIRALTNGSTLQIITNDINLPWELLHDGDNFLAIKHCVTRLLRAEKAQRQHKPPERSSRFSCLLLGNPTGDLPATIAEISAIEDILYTAKDRVRYRSLFGSHISVTHLRSLLATQEYDLIHYAGHAQPVALTLADEHFRVEDILTALHNHPIVVLNACATGRIRSTETDFSEMTGETQSLVAAFIQAGATAVIGMLWPIPDHTSMLFGQVLYTHLVAGETIGEALRLSRASMRQQDPQGISWLAPVLYGNPLQRAVPSALKEVMGTVLAIRFHGAMVDYQRIKQPTPNDRVHYLSLLCQHITHHGGFVLSANEATLLAVFGLYQATDSNAFQAILAARDALARSTAWQTLLPAMAVVSGELAATHHSRGTTTDGVAASPFLFGPSVLEAQQLLELATPGQILVNELARTRCKKRFHCHPWVSATRSGDQVAAYELVPLPLDIRADTLPLDVEVSIGREPEHKRLEEAWQTAQAGYGQVIGISGEAGIGKSHLVRTFRRRISRTPVHWLQVACTANLKNTTYGLLARLFCGLLDLPDQLDEQQIDAMLRHHFTDHPPADTALLADLLGMQSQELRRQEQSVYQHQLYLLLAHLLLQIMQQMPVVLVLEDAHWSDAASLEVLTLLANHLEEAPLLLLLAYRSDWQPPWVGRDYFQNIHLRPLGRSDRRQLYAALLHTAHLPDELLLLLERSSGNPLFLTEILVTLLHKGLLIADSGANAGWQLTGTLQARELPDSVRSVIDMRLDQLDHDERSVLAMAAILGTSFTPAMLRWVLTLTEDLLYDHLRRLTVHDFLRHVLGSDHYDFRHDLIRDVAYMKIPTPQRQLWHRQVAEALARRDAQRRESVAALAHHYFQSLVDEHGDDLPLLNREGDPATTTKALTYLLQSGQDALERYGGREAVALFQRCRLVAELLPHDSTRQAKIYTGLGNAYRLLNDFDQAVYAFAEAHAALHHQPLTLETRPQATNLARLLARQYMWRAQYPMAEAWIEMGLERVQHVADPACRSAAALLHIQAGSICYNQGDYQKAEVHCHKGLAIAQECKDEDAVAEGNFILGAIMRSTGNYALALSHYSASLAIYEQQHNLYQLHRVRMNIGLALFFKGDWPQALSYYAEVLKFWETIGEENLQAGMCINIGLAEQYLGNWNEALRYFTRALAICQAIKNQKWTALVYSNLGALYIAQESWQLAREQLTLSLEVLETHAIDAYLADVKSHLALVELAEQDVDSALDLARQAVDLAQTTKTQQHHAIALRSLGRVFAAKQEFSQAFTYLAHSRQILEALGERYELARTLYQQAVAKAVAGESSDAMALCTEALAIFQALGAKKDLAQAQSLKEGLMHRQ